MNRNIIVPDEPAGSLYRLQEALRSLAEQLNDGATAIMVPNVSLASGLNKIRHGLKSTPASVVLSPRASITWYIPTQPDGEFLYIQTSGAVTADLHIWL